MDLNQFIKYLKTPGLLQEIPISELEKLIQKFPYCQNLRFFMARKSQMEESTDFDKHLQLAATFVSDRSFLYKKISQQDMEDNGHSAKDDHSPPLFSIDFSDDSQQPESTNSETTDNIPNKTIELRINQSDPVQFGKIEDHSSNDEVGESRNVVYFEDLIGKKKKSEKKHNPSPQLIDQEKNKPQEEPLQEEIELFKEKSVISDIDNLPPDVELLELPEDLGDFSYDKDENTAPANTPALGDESPSQAPGLSLTPTDKSGDNDADCNDKPNISPTPKSSFISWTQRYEPNPKKEKKKKKKKKKASSILKQLKRKELKLRKDSKKSKKKKKEKIEQKKKKIVKGKVKATKKLVGKKKKTKKFKIKAFAQKSLTENNEIVSETLAQILVKQGSYKKAIQVYERLCLIFPEKSTFFAAQIEKLKNF